MKNRWIQRRPWMSRFLVVICAVLALQACTGRLARDGQLEQRQGRLDQRLAIFSSNATASGLPAQWSEATLGLKKRPTEYSLVPDVNGKPVLRARADAAASALMHPVRVRLERAHHLNWRWKVSSLVSGADNSSRQFEDAPARVILSFDGDKSSLGFRDQMFFEHARVLTGREVPYATLMYIWARDKPLESVITNPHTGRVRMVVVENGPKRVGEWVTYNRDIVADYLKAFGEPPGALTAIGVMTDTDNTGENVEAWYGDIRLRPEPH